MPPRKLSRHVFVEGLLDDSSNFYLTEREPYRYRGFSDNRRYVVKEGDTLFTLAHKYFKGFVRPSGLFWVIADFQPTPIIDATLKLPLGQTLFIPSHRTVQERIFSERRRSITTLEV